MTREEEIKCAASHFAAAVSENLISSPDRVIIFSGGFAQGFTQGANWADKFPRENAERVIAMEMDVWVARDEDGQLAMYDNDPHKWKDYFATSRNKRNSYLSLSPELFPGITFENSPVKMRLILEQ